MYNISSVILTVCLFLMCNFSNAQTSVEDRLDKIQALLDNGTITQLEADHAIDYAQNAPQAEVMAGERQAKVAGDGSTARAAFVEYLKDNPNKFSQATNFSMDGKVNLDKNWRNGDRPEKFEKPNGN